MFCNRRLIMPFVVRGKVKPKPDTELWLEEDPEGIVLWAKTDHMPWNILRIKPDGTMRRTRAVSNSLGFKLDNLERVVEIDI